LAEGIVEVTAGSGTKLHSWSKTVGANTVHDEFTLPGEYPYASYFALAIAISCATADSHIIQLMAGSSLNVRIRRITWSQHANATTAALDAIQVWRLSTAGTGGVAVTPAKLDTADAASGATAMTLPTAKGTEVTQLTQEIVVMRQAILATSAQFDDSWEWYQKPGMKPIIIAAGTSNGIAFKHTTAIAAATANVTIEFVETNFL